MLPYIAYMDPMGMLKYKRVIGALVFRPKTYLMAIDVHPKDGKIFESPNFICCPKITIM